jgi:hypothetical protein
MAPPLPEKRPRLRDAPCLRPILNVPSKVSGYARSTSIRSRI